MMPETLAWSVFDVEVAAQTYLDSHRAGCRVSLGRGDDGSIARVRHDICGAVDVIMDPKEGTTLFEILEPFTRLSCPECRLCNWEAWW